MGLLHREELVRMSMLAGSSHSLQAPVSRWSASAMRACLKPLQQSGALLLVLCLGAAQGHVEIGSLRGMGGSSSLQLLCWADYYQSTLTASSCTYACTASRHASACSGPQ